MKVLVAYVSRTGNTKKVAEAIFQGMQEEKEIKELQNVGNLEGYDLTFIGQRWITAKANPMLLDWSVRAFSQKM